MASSDPDDRFRFTVLELGEVDSTNAHALRYADSLPHGTVVVAERQLAGRGRAGRSWHSPEGNLYMTLLLKDLPEPLHKWGMAWLTLAMAVAVCRVLEGYGLTPRIKWPNDVLLQGRKVAGVLAEARWQKGHPAAVALGVGVNLNMPPEEARKSGAAVSVVGQVLGKAVDITGFARQVLDTFAAAVDGVDHTGPERLREGVRRRACFWGRKVAVEHRGSTVCGRAVDLDDHGALLVEDHTGERHAVTTGDLTCW